MSISESDAFFIVQQIITRLGNIGTLFSNDQFTRLNTVLEEKPNIPVEWTQEQILEALKTWSNTIKFSSKTEEIPDYLGQDYLYDEVQVHFGNGLWMYSLNNMPI
ncbi:hypothetical protein RclHR1_03080006 [Rhizophagus clarus]|uniref:Uncharacterized protein n=1 Tax=Rhizophagus clarus TaxID=94130 RepID=A0A2Z6R5U8_9GLOM|nr:hypothetical protein RclHR1_03080006 [Rhizophagus clarus]